MSHHEVVGACQSGGDQVLAVQIAMHSKLWAAQSRAILMQAAALAGARWLGRGDKKAADQAAVDQMRKVSIPIDLTTNCYAN